MGEGRPQALVARKVRAEPLALAEPRQALVAWRQALVAKRQALVAKRQALVAKQAPAVRQALAVVAA